MEVYILKVYSVRFRVGTDLGLGLVLVTLLQ